MGRVFILDELLKNKYYNHAEKIRPHRLMVRTRAFQACNPGSIPGGVTITESVSKQSSLNGEFCVILATFLSFI